MLFDFDHVPFSRAGRFLTLSMMVVPGEAERRAPYLRSVAGGDERPSLGRLCRIVFTDKAGNEVEPDFVLTPVMLQARSAAGRVDFVIGAGETLHIRGEGMGLRFHLEGSRYDYVYRPPQGGHCLVAAAENLRLVPSVTSGDLEVTGTWQRDHSDAVSMAFSGDPGFEGVVQFFRTVASRKEDTGFETALRQAETEFEGWLNAFPQALPGQEEAHRLAAYLLSANRVPVEGALTRPSIYMSKNGMINIWSWDNAFSAIGIASVDPQLAFDQFAVIFDHQDASGLLPDYVNDRDVLFAFTKPPVHGWAVSLIAAQVPGFLDPGRKAYLGRAIARQVTYWLTHARAGEEDLPCYFHGNDSGWDNASFFSEGGPVLSPDLPVFLILACDALADLLIEEKAEADRWRATGNHLMQLLLDRLWTGETFQPRLAHAPERVPGGNSLIQFMPLLLGKRLPRDMAARLIARFRTDGFLTEWGPATESPASPYYEPDGYWRGPIWAPTTLLIHDAMVKQGEQMLADDIALRFTRLAAQHGMAENFDAMTGKGLRDRAFAWTSAVYSHLSRTVSPNQA